MIKFKDTCSLPWVIRGDFNAYVKEEEKVGYPGVHIEPCDERLYCLNSCEVEDLSAVGCTHTWCNNQNSESWIRIELDRVLGNELWMEKYVANALFLEYEISNHSPMIV